MMVARPLWARSACLAGLSAGNGRGLLGAVGSAFLLHSLRATSALNFSLCRWVGVAGVFAS